MSRQSDTADDSPTDELPVLTELDVVELDPGPAPLAADDGPPALGGDDEIDAPAATGRFFRPDELPDIEPFTESDEELEFLRRQILLLEATLDDKDADIASLAERLKATRDAVERRDETERQLREELAEAAAHRRRLESRLAEAEGLAASYADRVAELTSALRTLEQTVSQRDAAFADLEAELIARETRVVEREKALALAEAAPPAPSLPETPLSESELEVALARSRDEAAALAAYVDCRRAHWLALEAQIEEHRARVRELELEVEQRAARERQEAERADAEARRAEALRAELARLRASRETAAFGEPAPREDPGTPPEDLAAASEGTPESPSGPPAWPEDAPTATLRIRAPETAPPASDSKATPRGALVCLTSDPPREYKLGLTPMLIGRGPHCDVRIATHFVSREHARVFLGPEDVVIEDLGSKNGVFVNAIRVERGPLRHGDLVTIGETQFRFEAPASV